MRAFLIPQVNSAFSKYHIYFAYNFVFDLFCPIECKFFKGKYYFFFLCVSVCLCLCVCVYPWRLAQYLTDN